MIFVKLQGQKLGSPVRNKFLQQYERLGAVLANFQVCSLKKDFSRGIPRVLPLFIPSKLHHENIKMMYRCENKLSNNCKIATDLNSENNVPINVIVIVIVYVQPYCNSHFCWRHKLASPAPEV